MRGTTVANALVTTVVTFRPLGAAEVAGYLLRRLGLDLLAAPQPTSR